MKTSALLLALALGLSAWSVTAQEQDSPPPSGARPPRHQAGLDGPGAPGGRRGLHLLPPRAQELLNLTADQQKQVAELETDVKAKLAKILTSEQLQQLKQMGPPQHRGGKGVGGPGGRAPADGPNSGAGAESNQPAPAQE